VGSSTRPPSRQGFRGGRYFFLAVMAKLTFTLPPI
jgi:hypothetical protein